MASPLRVLLSAALLCALALPAQTPSVEGIWEGQLKVPNGITLRLRINLSKAPDGTLKATLDSPDQGASGIPVDTVTFGDGTLKWEIARIKASYEGKLNEAGSEFAGKFTQGMEFDLNLKRLGADEAKGPRRPQEPKPPFPYKSEMLTFPSTDEDVLLAGTLTIPAGKGPHPAVILITGSGPQDRDESLMSHKPFWVLADHLSRQGIAVLRYDDRGFGKSTGKFTTATSVDFSNDAEGAFNFLRKRAEIDSKRIGFAGHSEGAIIAPMVAARRAEVAFVVLMAGTAVPGSDVMIAQALAINRAAGNPEEAAQKNTEIQKKLFAVMRDENDPEELQKKLQQVLETEAPQLPEAQRIAQARNLAGPWFRFFAAYNPAVALPKVKCPVLAINGENDLQVLPDQNLTIIEKTLKEAGNEDVTAVRLPGLNHLFQTSKTGLVGEYGQIEETMSPKAMDTISAWIRKRTGLATP